MWGEQHRLRCAREERELLILILQRSRNKGVVELSALISALLHAREGATAVRQAGAARADSWYLR